MVKVCVIIVTYNPKQWIEKVLQSLYNSSLSVEVIIVDNGSTDGSIAFIQNNYSQVDLIQTSENLGFGKANNIGIKKAYDLGADYVFLLNQDAWIKQDTLEKLVSVAIKYPEFGIISPMHLNGSGNALDTNFTHFIAPQKTPRLVSDIYMNSIEDTIYQTDYVNAAAWLLSCNCIKTVGGFNPSFFMYAEDDNYLQRVKYHGLKIGIYPKTEIHHDRAERSTPKQLVVNEIVEKRNWILKYSNPLKEFELDEDMSNLKKGIKVALLKGRFSLASTYKLKLQKLSLIRNEIFANYTASKKTGTTFL